MRPARILLIAALCSFGQSQPPSPTPTKTGQDKQQSTESKETKTEEHKDPSISVSVVNTPVASDASQHEKERSSADWWIRILTGVIAFATVAQAYIYFRQKELMRDALCETKKAAEAATASAKATNENLQAAIRSERAWIMVSVDQIPKLPSLNVPNVRLEIYYVYPLLKNCGRTMATITLIKARVHLVPIGESLPSIPNYNREPHRTFRIEYKIPMIPNGTLQPLPVGTSVEDINAVINERKYNWWIYGLVNYIDAYDKPHTTRFCVTYIEQSGMRPLPSGFYISGPEAYNDFD
jgi:hypothetical protein